MKVAICFKKDSAVTVLKPDRLQDAKDIVGETSVGYQIAAADTTPIQDVSSSTVELAFLEGIDEDSMFGDF